MIDSAAIVTTTTRVSGKPFVNKPGYGDMKI